MTSKEANDYIKKNLKLSNGKLSIKTGLTVAAVEHRIRRLGLRRSSKEYSTVEEDVINLDESNKERSLKEKYKILLKKISEVEVERDAIKQAKSLIQTHEIVKSKSSENEAVAVILASDFHVEERVRKETVNDRNEYNLSIASKRSDEFFINAVKLIKKEQQDVNINKVVLALLGDFISGNIHQELLANCSLPPIKAMIYAQNLIVSGILYILKNTDVDLIIPCHVGNHPRITQKVHISNEQGNSLEYYMYHVLADYFKDEKRITWIIAEGYHTYVKVFDWMIRFHHGHNIKYGQGIGGLFIPTYKAISQWNKVCWADYDCFGHLHTQRDGGNFISNGSLIGYNAFAVSIKGDYEPPRQQFFLIDSKRGKTVTTPILFSI